MAAIISTNKKVWHIERDRSHDGGGIQCKLKVSNLQISLVKKPEFMAEELLTSLKQSGSKEKKKKVLFDIGMCCVLVSHFCCFSF